MSLLRRLKCSYNHYLIIHPYKLQAVQIATLLGIGDFIAQKFVENRKSYDVTRTARFVTAGFFIGPGIHVWYKILERMYGRKTDTKTTFLKVITDQLIFAPTALALFLTYIHVMHGNSKDQIKKSFRKDYVEILKKNYTFWPAVQAINFSLVPFNFRVVFSQMMGIIWNTYLSWKLHKFSK